MSILASLTTDTSIAVETDRLGGGSKTLATGIYTMKVALAYITHAKSEAMALNVVLKGDAGELKQTLWMTSGKEKGCKNFYEKDGAKHYLPGFLLANALCLLTVGKEIGQLGTEEKLINLYSADAKAEVPTKVPMITDLIGQEISAAVFQQVVDKNKKNEVTGAYEPTGETREENEIDKFFRSRDMMTVAEIVANGARAQKGEEAQPATFHKQWLEKWEGKTRNLAKGASNGASKPQLGGGSMFGGVAKPAVVNAANKPTSSLFGNAA